MDPHLPRTLATLGTKTRDSRNTQEANTGEPRHRLRRISPRNWEAVEGPGQPPGGIRRSERMAENAIPSRRSQPGPKQAKLRSPDARPCEAHSEGAWSQHLVCFAHSPDAGPSSGSSPLQARRQVYRLSLWLLFCPLLFLLSGNKGHEPVRHVEQNLRRYCTIVHLSNIFNFLQNLCTNS